jgi:hypothetical protein
MPLMGESNLEYPVDGDGRTLGEGDGDAEAAGPMTDGRMSTSPTREIAAIAAATMPRLARAEGLMVMLHGRPNTLRRWGVASTEASARSRTQRGALAGAWAA